KPPGGTSSRHDRGSCVARVTRRKRGGRAILSRAAPALQSDPPPGAVSLWVEAASRAGRPAAVLGDGSAGDRPRSLSGRACIRLREWGPASRLRRQDPSRETIPNAVGGTRSVASAGLDRDVTSRLRGTAALRSAVWPPLTTDLYVYIHM